MMKTERKTRGKDAQINILLRKFKSPKFHNAARAGLAIKLRERLLNLDKVEHQALLENTENYLKLVMNTPILTSAIIRKTKEKQKIDPYYLPNQQLPSFLNEPTGTHDEFIRTRVMQHVLAHAQEKTLQINAVDYKEETLLKASLAFIDSHDESHPLYSAHLKTLEESIGSLLPQNITLDEVSKEKAITRIISQMGMIHYFSTSEREKLRKFPYEGKLYSANIRKSNKAPAEITVASTKSMQSHGNKNTAALVLNNRGEIFFYPHESGKHFHSSTMKGGNVLFAGEIQVKKGVILKLTDYSGHYRPTFENMFSAYQVMKNQGLDFSQCDFRVLNEEEYYKKLADAQSQDPAFSERINSDRLSHEDIQSIDNIYKKSSIRYGEKEFAALATSKKLGLAEKQKAKKLGSSIKTALSSLRKERERKEKLDAIKKIIENPRWENTVKKTLGFGGTNIQTENGVRNVPEGLSFLHKKKAYAKDLTTQEQFNLFKQLLHAKKEPSSRRHKLTQEFYNTINDPNKTAKDVRAVNDKLNKAFPSRNPSVQSR